MTEYLAGGAGAGSESEGEELDEASQCVVPQAMTSRGNMAAQKSSVRLVELGPRITMELLKIEEGMLDGEFANRHQATHSVSNSSGSCGLKKLMVSHEKTQGPFTLPKLHECCKISPSFVLP